MLDIIHQDSAVVIVNKPSGLLVHRSLIDKHETRFALQLVRDQIGRKVYPVHRLDKPTSGLLMFALDSVTARYLGEQFTQHTVQKWYIAVVRGFIASEGCIDYPLQEQLDALADSQARTDKDHQSALTHYVCLKQAELPFKMGRYDKVRYSLVALNPRTGRKHQLRRHMKHIFHPIVGDTTHGDGKHNTLFRQQWNCQRLLLHAAYLSFKHPDGTQFSIQAPLAEDFQRILLACELGIGDHNQTLQDCLHRFG